MSEARKDKIAEPIVVPQPARARSLNDCLALERTVMSNERTMLAYVRTALALLVVGVTIIKFFQSQGMLMLGYGLMALGVICLSVGGMRFTEMWHRLNEMGRCKDRKWEVDDEID